MLLRKLNQLKKKLNRSSQICVQQVGSFEILKHEEEANYGSLISSNVKQAIMYGCAPQRREAVVNNYDNNTFVSNVDMEIITTDCPSELSYSYSIPKKPIKKTVRVAISDETNDKPDQRSVIVQGNSEVVNVQTSRYLDDESEEARKEKNRRKKAAAKQRKKAKKALAVETACEDKTPEQLEMDRKQRISERVYLGLELPPSDFNVKQFLEMEYKKGTAWAKSVYNVCRCAKALSLATDANYPDIMKKLNQDEVNSYDQLARKYNTHVLGDYYIGDTKVSDVISTTKVTNDDLLKELSAH